MTITPLAFSYVSTLVTSRSAIQLPPGKEYLVESRLIPLAKQKGFSGPNSLEDFILKARNDRALQADIVEAMTTNETSWFRDTVPFDLLRGTILPERRQVNRGQMRIWSAACSTGQEAYSMSMTLLDTGESNFEILGTDISREALGKAKSGHYSQLEVNRGLPAPLLVRYFKRNGTGWEVGEHVSKRVSFRSHNLQDPLIGAAPFDVIFLRNVLIYFDAATKREILFRMAKVAAPGAFLVLGAAEVATGADSVWGRVSTPQGTLFQLKGGAS